jgi:putative ABC transport system permease protein
MMHLSSRMLLHQRARVIATTLGLGFLFFLSAAQVGVFVGWCYTTQLIINHSGVDVWVMAEHTTALEYGSPIPKHRVEQVRNVPGVAWAEAMHLSGSVWRQADGHTTSVSVIGLDKSCAAGPWNLPQGRVEDVHLPFSVIVDELYQERLGVHAIGDQAQLFGKRAVVHGISREVRTFSSTPCVFTSLATARRYDARYEDDEVTYVLARVAPGMDPDQVSRSIAASVPSVEALTTPEFALRTTKYWMLRTGAGVTVILTALLGIVVGAVVNGQTLFTITQDNLNNYGTLMALGFSRARLLGCVLLQALILSSGGIVLGGLSVVAASAASTRFPVPLRMTPEVFALLVAVSVLGGLGGAFFSIRAVLRIDPATVFRG